MEKFFNKLEEKLMPLANFFGQQRHLLALRDGIIGSIPMTIIGSIFLILAFPPVTAATVKGVPLIYDLFKVWNDWAGANIGNILAPFNVTMGILSLFVVTGTSYSLAKSYDKKALNYAMSSMVIYFLVITPIKDGAIPIGNMDGKGILLAMLLGLGSVEIMRFIEDKGWTIKMPKGVPPIVSDSFKVLFPMTITLLLFFALSLFCQATTGKLIPDVFLSLFAGVKASVDNIFTVTILTGFENLLFGFGVHPTTVVGPVLDTLESMNIAENASLVAKGLEATNIYNQSFWAFYAALGGGGATLALSFLLLKSKSKQNREIGKIALIPSLFNINEPLIFGLPIFLNPILIIPFMIAPMVNVIIGWLVTAAGFVNVASVAAPWTSPAPIGAIISTMDWRAGVLVIMLIVIDALIYFPFVRMYDRAKILEEKEEEKETAVGGA